MAFPFPTFTLPSAPSNPVVNVACNMYGGATLQASVQGVPTTLNLQGPSTFDPTLQSVGITVVSAPFWQEWLVQNPTDGLIVGGAIYTAPIGAQILSQSGAPHVGIH